VIARTLWIGLATVLFVSVAVSAQQTDDPARPPTTHTDVLGLPRTSADDLLHGQAAARSFDSLPAVLKRGHEIVVTTTRGERRRGRVVSISPEQVVVAAPVSAGEWEAIPPMLGPLLWEVDAGIMLKRRLFPAADRTFTEASVNRIDIVDPAGNGALLGGLAGTAIAGAVYLAERSAPDSSLKGIYTFMAIVWGVPMSFRVGHVFDRAINRAIYLRPVPARPAVMLAPLVAPGVTGIVVNVALSD
jgi:hypothetical protein